MIILFESTSNCLGSSHSHFAVLCAWVTHMYMYMYLTQTLSLYPGTYMELRFFHRLLARKVNVGCPMSMFLKNISKDQVNFKQLFSKIEHSKDICTPFWLKPCFPIHEQYSILLFKSYVSPLSLQLYLHLNYPQPHYCCHCCHLPD